jgi:hypothetical protein
MVKRYNVHSEIDIGAHCIEDESGCYVLAADYDDLRAQCGGMEMEIVDLRQDAERWRYFRKHRTYGWVLEPSPEAADAYADKQVEWDRIHKAGQFYDGSRDGWPTQSDAAVAMRASIDSMMRKSVPQKGVDRE